MQDGVSWHCNRCGYHVKGDGEEYEHTDEEFTGVYADLTDRKIRKKTCEKFHVTVRFDEVTGEIDAHYYPVTKEGKEVGLKVRNLPKHFVMSGDTKGTVELFGQAVCNQGGKKLLITGGELDCLAAYQMLYDKFPAFEPSVVSLPKGENVASIKENMEFIKLFEEVLIYTDMDEVGRKTADDIAKLIGPKAKIVATSEKDASDMLVNNKQQEFINAFFNASARRPEGIIVGSDISLASIMQPTSVGYDLPYPVLNQKVEGLRKGELTLLTAGSGIGKSTLARELGYHLRSAHNLNIGNMFLEEPLEKTIQGYIAIDRNIPLSQLRKNPNLLTQAEWEESYNKLIATGWYGFKHFGSLATEDLMDRMRHLAYGEGCDFIILDHLSMVFSGQKNDNERMAIDNALTELAAFINESGVGVICVVHLSRNKSKGSFNEGAFISLNDLRGSGALEQLSWNVWGLERDQQHDGEENLSRIRVLKCREIGYTGLADTCEYDFNSGRLLPTTKSIVGEY